MMVPSLEKKMSSSIQKVAVLGAGVMGAQIAAHLSNAKIPVYAFDMSQEIAEKGVAFCRKLKPNPFYNPKTADLITPLNYDDHLEKIGECDWIIEVIAERLDWKRSLFERIIPHIKNDTVITSNTSGLSVESITEGMPEDFSRRFFITHFFNPPRYMKLVEIISGEKTDPDIISSMAGFLENVLGKGVVYAKDTPNFVANRIGVFGMMVTLDEARKKKLSIEDVDALTGTLIGRAKSATFRTADVVGLDTLAFVAMNSFQNCQEDESREIFAVPDYLKQMIDNGWLGQKSGQGFYKKIKKGVIHSIDLETLEYTPQEKKRYAGVRLARENTHTQGKIHALAASPDVAGTFTWEVLTRTINYAANRLGEIADDILNIDRAMRWGFAWDFGPFELWDILGLEESVKRMKAEGKSIAPWVTEMLQAGFTSFYKYVDGRRCFYDPDSGGYLPIPVHASELTFEMRRKTDNRIKDFWSASVVDMGDGVAGVEFHSVLQPLLNPIDGSVMEAIQWATNWVKENQYKGLIISGDGVHFSAGANLNLILDNAYRQDWKAIENMTRTMQDILQGLRFAPFPVVAAPFGLVLGGGYETIGACDKIVAAAEMYCGLVEVGVGLIPGAGGNLRMLLKTTDKMAPARPGPFPVVMKAFEAIGFAKVSTSAKEAQAIGYLTRDDVIVINRDHLLHTAKETVLKLAENYQAPVIREDIILPGEDGRLVVESSIHDFMKAGKISEHDGLIAGKLAYVLTGGERGNLFTPVTEQYLLDIEREMFVSLCGEPKSIDRIGYMLKKGKPLRN